MDVKKAWEIVKKNNPGMKPFTCNEGEKHYMFSLVPENLVKGDAYGSGGVFMVDKNSGKYMVVPWTVANNEPIVNIIDTSIF